MHTPVLLQTVIDSLDIQPNGKYIDGTYGEGGYTKAIADKGGKVLAIDLDENQIEKGIKNKMKDVKFAHGNFADIVNIAKKHHYEQADGIVFDLGLSMEQILRSGRGFSYKSLKEPLDMRIDKNSEKTAENIINTLSSNDLYNLFAKYSEEIYAQRIAEAIVRMRVKKRIRIVGDLINVIDYVLGERDTAVYRRIFQSLRIAVNSEFDNLNNGLQGAVKTVSKTGRIVVVTFHSLEDRIVKRFIKSNNLHELKKVVKGDSQKSFEKSAKLRVFSR